MLSYSVFPPFFFFFFLLMNINIILLAFKSCNIKCYFGSSFYQFYLETILNSCFGYKEKMPNKPKNNTSDYTNIIYVYIICIYIYRYIHHIY